MNCSTEKEIPISQNSANDQSAFGQCFKRQRIFWYYMTDTVNFHVHRIISIPLLAADKSHKSVKRIFIHFTVGKATWRVCLVCIDSLRWTNSDQPDSQDWTINNPLCIHGSWFCDHCQRCDGRWSQAIPYKVAIRIVDGAHIISLVYALTINCMFWRHFESHSYKKATKSRTRDLSASLKSCESCWLGCARMFRGNCCVSAINQPSSLSL